MEALRAFMWTLLGAACLAQWGFSGHYPALSALCSVCVQGLVATAEPAVVFTFPAWASASWSVQVFFQPPAASSALTHLPVMQGEGQVPVLMSF